MGDRFAQVIPLMAIALIPPSLRHLLHGFAGVDRRCQGICARFTRTGTRRLRQLAARQRFDGAIAAAGKGLEDVLWRVVCACESLPDAERALEWPARSGKLVLRIALDRVADFYRIG